MVTQTTAVSMEPLSARIPGDLYVWLAQLQIDGATTNSDKLRILLGQLKRQHDGAFDYMAAHAWARDLTTRLREGLVRIESETDTRSEIVSLLLEHLTALLALLVSQSPATEADARKFEDALVRRVFGLGEMLLRQGITPEAAAYDPAVVRRHLGKTVELVTNLQLLKGPTDV